MSEHYFSAEPSGRAEPRVVTFAVGGRDYRLVSSSGVFSGDQLDLGTAVLLRSAPLPPGGRVLDLGCGYGPIACVLGCDVPDAEVWAVDVNNRALELTQTNVDALGLRARVQVRHPDDVPPDLEFTQIWSNPPVRIGKPALRALLETWLPRLSAEGVAWLVVARNLGADSLQRWLTEAGWDCRRQASAKGYRVLTVRRPPDRSLCGRAL